jgi:flagellar basal-body rod modification protein FlgD
MSLNGTTGTTIQPTSSTTASGGLGSSGSSSTSSTDPLLGKDAFLNLMMTQMKDQDPLNPSDPSQYLGELAQLTSVEQETNIATATTQTETAQTDTTALSLLGHTVNYTDANGNTQTGLVQKVDFTSSGPSLTVGGTGGISPADVTEVS